MDTSIPGRMADGIESCRQHLARVLDNIYIEQLWQSVKCEDGYLKDHASVPELNVELDDYWRFCNQNWQHQSLEQCT